MGGVKMRDEGRWFRRLVNDVNSLAMTLPREVKASFGVRLCELQAGGTPLNMKPVTQFGPGFYELRDNFDTNTYRVIYVLDLGKALYVLHAFMKKSKSGIGLPKPDAALIEARLRHARDLDRGE